jgi:hypothetical protein
VGLSCFYNIISNHLTAKEGESSMTIEISAGKELGIEGTLEAVPVDDLCKPIVDYHRALEIKDEDLLAANVCAVVYRVYSAASDQFVDWEPWSRLSREQVVGNFSKAFANEDFYYENRVQITHVKLNGDEALVRTMESGRTWKNRDWEDVEVLWHTTPSEGGVWKIAGHIHHLS